MFMNQKLRDNIDASISNTIKSVQGISVTLKNNIISKLSLAVNKAIKDTDSSNKLAEKAGPSLWATMHWLAKVADNENNQDIYLDYLDILCEGHPCKDVCREHLQENLQIVNPYKYSSMFRHSVDLHNRVNRQLNKPTMTLAEAESIYNLDCDSCNFKAKTKPKK